MSRFLIAVVLLVNSSALRAQAPSPANASAQLTTDQVYELSLATASDRPPSACVSAIINDAKTAVSKADPLLLKNHLSFLQDQLCTTYLVLSSDQFKTAVKGNQALAPALTEQEIEKLAVKKLKSMSQQNGASSGSGGSTNLTSKGLASKVLSVASEYGALSQSISGQTTTVQGTIAGVPLVLLGKGLLVDCRTKIFAVTPCVHHRFIDQLANISYSVSFENNPNSTTATGTPTTSTTGTAQQVKVTAQTRSINAFSFKWAAIRTKITSAQLSDAFTKIQASDAAKAIDEAITAMANLQIKAGSSYQTWLSQKGASLYAAAQADPTGALAEKTWEGLSNSITEALGAPIGIDEKAAAKSPVLKAAAALGKAYNAYLGTEDSIANSIAVPPILSFEYDDNRPPSEPSDSVIRVIFQRKWARLTWTINGAVSIYNSSQNAIPGFSRLRDGQVASEADHNFNLKVPFSNNVAATVSGAFYFQRQSSPAILDVTPGTPVDGVTFTGLPATASQVYAQKGNIDIGQVKLSIGSGSSVTVPLSVTYSNRTELITKPAWKGQIGVSYDFDSLFSNTR